MFGGPVCGGDVREPPGARLAARWLERVLAMPDDFPDGIALLAVERIGERGLLRLVVRRQRAVHHAGGREQPRLAVRLQDERIDAGDRVHARGVFGWPV